MEMLNILIFFSTGHEVHDYGDLEFEDFKDDPKLHNINNLKSVSEAGKKVIAQVFVDFSFSSFKINFLVNFKCTKAAHY